MPNAKCMPSHPHTQVTAKCITPRQSTCTHACSVHPIKVRLHNLGPSLTLVWTMWGLCALAALTVWKMSTAPSTLTLSISLIQVMNTPLRDMPSLKAKRKAFSTRKHNSTIRNTYYSATVYLIMPNTTLTDRNHMPACMYMLLQLQIAVSLYCI